MALGAVVFALISESISTLGPVSFKLVRRRRLVPSMAVLLVILFATTSLVYDAPALSVDLQAHRGDGVPAHPQGPGDEP